MVRVPVESTDVKSIGWEPIPGAIEPIGVMEVEFYRPASSIYMYFEVPRAFFEEFLNAPSKGKFANFVLKRSKFPYQKIA